MIRHIWSVLCQNASIDVQTNLVSLLSVVEGITVLSELDAAHPVILHAELVSLWQREQIDVPVFGKMRATYTDPNGHESVPIFLQIDLSQGHFHRTRINVTGIPITTKGIYTFKVEYQIDGSDELLLAATIPLLVFVQVPVAPLAP